MENEKKLEKEFDIYENLAKADKKIDVASLMINALETQDKNLVSGKQRKWAYLFSVGLPPLGLIFALVFYFNDKADARRVANICVILTILSVLSFWLIGKMMFSGSGVDLNQIQQLKVDDINNLIQQNN